MLNKLQFFFGSTCSLGRLMSWYNKGFSCQLLKLPSTSVKEFLVGGFLEVLLRQTQVSCFVSDKEKFFFLELLVHLAQCSCLCSI